MESTGTEAGGLRPQVVVLRLTPQELGANGPMRDVNDDNQNVPPMSSRRNETTVPPGGNIVSPGQDLYSDYPDNPKELVVQAMDAVALCLVRTRVGHNKNMKIQSTQATFTISADQTIIKSMLVLLKLLIQISKFFEMEDEILDGEEEAFNKAMEMIRQRLQQCEELLAHEKHENEKLGQALQNTKRELQNTKQELQNTRQELQNTVQELQNTKGERENWAQYAGEALQLIHKMDHDGEIINDSLTSCRHKVDNLTKENAFLKQAVKDLQRSNLLNPKSEFYKTLEEVEVPKLRSQINQLQIESSEMVTLQAELARLRGEKLIAEELQEENKRLQEVLRQSVRCASKDKDKQMRRSKSKRQSNKEQPVSASQSPIEDNKSRDQSPTPPSISAPTEDDAIRMVNRVKLAHVDMLQRIDRIKELGGNGWGAMDQMRTAFETMAANVSTDIDKFFATRQERVRQVFLDDEDFPVLGQGRTV